MFIILAVIITLSSLATVMTKSIVRAATYLLFTLLGTAGLYFLMGYTFLGSVQVMVYAGGIIVLYVFAILLTKGPKEDEVNKPTGRLTSFSVLLSLAGFAGTIVVLCTTHWAKHELLASPTEGGPGAITIQTIGNNLLSTGDGGYLLPFEAVSVLLLACIVGGLLIARKR